MAELRENSHWLQAALDSAVQQRWCTTINCTTCGSDDMRSLMLGRVIVRQSSLDRFELTAERAKEVVRGLQHWAPNDSAVDRHEQERAVRWLLYEIWAALGDEPFALLDGTPAGTVLIQMRQHYQGRQESRRRHDARQGVPKSEWKE